MAIFKGVVQSGQVSGSLTNFPAYVDLSSLPSSFWNTVKDGGGDIRVYSDPALTNELPREVVSCDTASQTGELHFKASTLSAGEDYYISVDGQRAGYAPTDQYGAQNVWTAAEAVYHVEDNWNDSAGSNNGTLSGSPSYIDGKIGRALSFDGVDDLVTLSSEIVLNDIDSWTIGFWALQTSGTNQVMIMGDLENDNRFYSRQNGTRWVVNLQATQFQFDSAFDWRGSWHYHVFVCDSSKVEFYLDGNLVGTTNMLSDTELDISHFGNAYVNDSYLWDGAIGETSIRRNTVSEEWVQASYNNQNDSGAFWAWSEVQADFANRLSVTSDEIYNVTVQKRNLWQVDLEVNKKYSMILNADEVIES